MSVPKVVMSIASINTALECCRKCAVSVGGDGGAGFHPEDGVVFARLRAEAVLELVEVALVSQIEVRPRHVAWRFRLALSHVLQEEI